MKLKFQIVSAFETLVSTEETFVSSVETFVSSVETFVSTANTLVSTAGIFVSTADILVSTEENKKGEKRNYANTWNYNKKRKQSTKKIIDVELIPDGYGWDTGI